ncbi:hypothetical protein ACOY7H_20790 [Enterobacter roggenkampii]|uniref:Uncharacterized protein n=1 Tax=Enterobacter roggenkampii TaxID=1812935 RepID=A0A837LKV1_9ENTR|nr:hypothetical protein [Enterobacter roggenkampii]KLQ05747.1 hypothetical protein ABF77_07770 [Enterobacter roggenkampii]MBW4236986.1 hypothetical protein [Enterobacter roggenkampii]GJK16229.1 hypothetical protein TUM16664_40050 [Enterobacter cloacae]
MQKQTFSAKALGNEYATGVSRPAVLTTKTFLPHQRVTTEGKAMGWGGITTTRFDEISTFAEKSGKCDVCGKACKRREKFYQTLNPFNKNADGSVKTYQEIRKEIELKATEWKLKPVRHAKCE